MEDDDEDELELNVDLKDEEEDKVVEDEEEDEEELDDEEELIDLLVVVPSFIGIVNDIVDSLFSGVFGKDSLSFIENNCLEIISVSTSSFFFLPEIDLNRQ